MSIFKRMPLEIPSERKDTTEKGCMEAAAAKPKITPVLKGSEPKVGSRMDTSGDPNERREMTFKAPSKLTAGPQI